MPRESAEARKARTTKILRALARAYRDAKIALRFRDPFELLIATILSAQCTDAKVNEVTAELFAKFGSAEALADAPPSEIEGLVRPTGFYRQKAKSIQSAARDLVERFDGEVPGSLEDLVTLRGVARKTANVVLGNAFDEPGIAVDTHVKRVSGRLGLTASEDPVTIEQDLMALLPRRGWTGFSLRAIHHGRTCCKARAPRCEECAIAALCPYPDESR